MNKLKILFTILLIFTASIFFAQKQEKITNLLSQNINIAGINSNYTIWIFLKDKGDITSKKRNNAKSLLNKHSLDRRQKLLKSNFLTDFYDIPLEKSYINSLTPYIIKLRHQSKWLNAISAEVKGEQINKIASFLFVKSIDIVRKGKYYTYSSEEIKPDENRVLKKPQYLFNYGPSLNQYEQINVPLIHNMGYSGKGVTICVLDAGFNNLEHEVFNRLDTIASFDFVNNDNNTDDEEDAGSGFHGTKTLSTIAGFYEGQLIAPAFGASYLLAKTENTDSETQIEEDNWVAAAEWAEALGTDILSTSLGYKDFDDGSAYEAFELDGNTTVITIASDIAASKGMLVVNSAGNEGSGITTINAPADGDSVLSVGAVQTDGLRSSFSSVGPTGDGRIKPDVMAMGSNVYVADVSGNNYTYSSGTSFSCPITAGAAALLWEIFPFANNMELIDALKQTADNAVNPNNEYGWGIIDLYSAYEYLAPKYTFSASFYINDGTNPLAYAQVILNTNQRLSDLNGYTVFEQILASENIKYWISKPGFSTVYDSVSIIDQDVDINITLVKASILAYPTPAQNTISFNITEHIPGHELNLSIYDSSGRLVKTIENYENKGSINISDLENGSYILKTHVNSSDYVSKFIVSK